MSERLGEAESLIDKKEISIKDYKRFREIGRLINNDEILYFASFDEALHLRLPEIAQKEGNWDWLEAEDEE
jgi:hypothetical protein